MSQQREFGLLEICGVYHQKAEVGALVKFASEKKRYTIQASNRLFSICTKPQNVVTRRGKSGAVKRTVLYTIIDWEHRQRGTENMVFGLGAETKGQCEEMLDRLTNNESQISHRNFCELDIEAYESPRSAHN